MPHTCQTENKRRVCSLTDVWTYINVTNMAYQYRERILISCFRILLYCLDKSFRRHLEHTDAHRHTRTNTAESNLDKIQHPSAHPPTPSVPNLDRAPIVLQQHHAYAIRLVSCWRPDAKITLVRDRIIVRCGGVFGYPVCHLVATRPQGHTVSRWQ